MTQVFEGFLRTLKHAEQLSKAYPGKVARVYGTPHGSCILRFDPEPLAQVDGMDLVHLAAYINGEKVRP